MSTARTALAFAVVVSVFSSIGVAHAEDKITQPEDGAFVGQHQIDISAAPATAFRGPQPSAGLSGVGLIGNYGYRALEHLLVGARVETFSFAWSDGCFYAGYLHGETECVHSFKSLSATSEVSLNERGMVVPWARVVAGYAWGEGPYDGTSTSGGVMGGFELGADLHFWHVRVGPWVGARAFTNNAPFAMGGLRLGALL